MKGTKAKRAAVAVACVVLALAGFAAAFATNDIGAALQQTTATTTVTTTTTGTTTTATTQTETTTDTETETEPPVETAEPGGEEEAPADFTG